MRRPKVRNAEGRCYELAWKTLSRSPERAKWFLVHGKVNGPEGSSIGHAWLESASVVYDPVLDVHMPREHYRRVYGAGDGARYTMKQASSRLLEENHYGPWGVVS